MNQYDKNTCTLYYYIGSWKKSSYTEDIMTYILCEREKRKERKRGYKTASVPKGFHYNTFIHLYSLDVSFWKRTTPNEHPVCNQNVEIDCLISEDCAFVVAI